jgi:hypothetical protein
MPTTLKLIFLAIYKLFYLATSPSNNLHATQFMNLHDLLNYIFVYTFYQPAWKPPEPCFASFYINQSG